MLPEHRALDVLADAGRPSGFSGLVRLRMWCLHGGVPALAIARLSRLFVFQWVEGIYFE